MFELQLNARPAGKLHSFGDILQLRGDIEVGDSRYIRRSAAVRRSEEGMKGEFEELGTWPSGHQLVHADQKVATDLNVHRYIEHIVLSVIVCKSLRDTHA
jgi:hypothetical protein